MSVTFDQTLDTSTLKGRSALVTGAASGIGLACATKLAEAGALVTLADMSDEAGQKAAQDLSSKGFKVQFVKCDVTSYQAQVETFKKAIRFGNGRIDLVIPNAGILAEKNLLDMVPAEAPSIDGAAPPEPGYSTAEVNLHAVYNTCFLAIHYFRLPQNGPNTIKPSIVLIASLAGYVGYPSSSTYSMAKFGVRGLFYGIRDHAARVVPPVRVNLVAPWFIETGMTKGDSFLQSAGGILLQVSNFVPMDRVTDVVLRFSADDSVHGRAAGVFPTANEDLGDDIKGSYGGQVLVKHITPIMQSIAKLMEQMEAQAQASTV